jgi:hypothetical protein
MILIENTCISDDIADQFFVCNIDKCKGACCVEGDAGAPLEENELQILKDIYPVVEPYLSDDGRRAIAEQGTYTVDEDGDYVTPIIGGRECAYAYYDQKSVLKCGIEAAFLDGKTDFKKPISCHLYPIRVTKYEQFHALNYDRWSICSPACSFGKDLGVPVYKFLKEPLIRAYGEGWYQELVEEIEENSSSDAKD